MAAKASLKKTKTTPRGNARAPQSQPIENRLLLDYAGLSEQATLRVSTLRRLVRAGRGPRLILVGRHHRFDPRDIRDWVDALRDATEA